MHRIQDALQINTVPHQCCNPFPTLPVRKQIRTAVSRSRYVVNVNIKLITNMAQEIKNKTAPTDTNKVYREWRYNSTHA